MWLFCHVFFLSVTIRIIITGWAWCGFISSCFSWTLLQSSVVCSPCVVAFSFWLWFSAIFIFSSSKRHLSNSKEHEGTAIWARVILSYYFAKRHLLWNIIRHENCTTSAFTLWTQLKTLEWTKSVAATDKTHSGVFDLCLHPLGSQKISAVHERELSGASNPVANVRRKEGKLTMRCFQREVYSTLVSFEPTFFSPVNLGHMSALFFLSLHSLSLVLWCADVWFKNIKSSSSVTEAGWITGKRRKSPTGLQLQGPSFRDKTYS